MEMMNYVLAFPTTGKTDLVDITREVSLRVRESGIAEGSVLVFVPGSTAALTTIEYESGVIEDLKEAIARLAPENLSKSSGRGILLMGALMDEVAFHRSPSGGMEVRLLKRRTREAPRPTRLREEGPTETQA